MTDRGRLDPMSDVMMEEVARSLLMTVIDNIDRALTIVEDEMRSSDAEFFAKLGQSVVATAMPRPVLYTIGHHPTILDRPLAEFPNCTVMCYDARSATSANVLDQVEILVYTAYAEIFVVDPDESAVNRMAWRYGKALHRAVLTDPTLSGLVEPVVSLPGVQVSNASARRVSDVTDELVYVQGCRLEYPFRIAELL